MIKSGISPAWTDNRIDSMSSNGTSVSAEQSTEIGNIWSTAVLQTPTLPVDNTQVLPADVS